MCMQSKFNIQRDIFVGLKQFKNSCKWCAYWILELDNDTSDNSSINNQ